MVSFEIIGGTFMRELFSVKAYTISITFKIPGNSSWRLPLFPTLHRSDVAYILTNKHSPHKCEIEISPINTFSSPVPSFLGDYLPDSKCNLASLVQTGPFEIPTGTTDRHPSCKDAAFSSIYIYILTHNVSYIITSENPTQLIGNGKVILKRQFVRYQWSMPY